MLTGNADSHFHRFRIISWFVTCLDFCDYPSLMRRSWWFASLIPKPFKFRSLPGKRLIVSGTIKRFSMDCRIDCARRPGSALCIYSLSLNWFAKSGSEVLLSLSAHNLFYFAQNSFHNQLSIKISLAFSSQLTKTKLDWAPPRLTNRSLCYSPLSPAVSRTSQSRFRTKMEQPAKEHCFFGRLQPNQDPWNRLVWPSNARPA